MCHVFMGVPLNTKLQDVKGNHLSMILKYNIVSATNSIYKDRIRLSKDASKAYIAAWLLVHAGITISMHIRNKYDYNVINMHIND